METIMVVVSLLKYKIDLGGWKTLIFVLGTHVLVEISKLYHRSVHKTIGFEAPSKI